MHKLVDDAAKMIREIQTFFLLEDGNMYSYHIRLGEIFENMFDEYEDFEWDKFSNACGYLTRAEVNENIASEAYHGTECYCPRCAT